jgi:hypothetical protein
MHMPSLFRKTDDLADARAQLAKRRTEQAASAEKQAELKSEIATSIDQDRPHEHIRRLEVAYRLEADHCDNLAHSVVVTERRVRELEKVAADALDQKTRVKTDAEIRKHIAALAEVQKTFDKTCEAMCSISKQIAPYVPEGQILVNYSTQALAEIGSITANIINLAKSHAAAVAAGHAPAALPTPEAPAPRPQPAPPQTWTRLIAMTDVAWTDDVGHIRFGQRGYEIDLPNKVAKSAMARELCLPTGDARAQAIRMYRSAKRTIDPRQAVPLDDGAAKMKAELTGNDERVPEPAVAPAQRKTAEITYTAQPPHAEKIMSSHAPQFTPMPGKQPYLAQIAATRSAIDEK